MRLRRGCLDEGESPEHFIIRFQRYMSRWVDLSKVEKTYGGICELFVKEQFLNSCSEDLAVYLRERSPDTIKEFTRIADQYLIVHKKNMAAATKDLLVKKLDNPENGSGDVNKEKLQCYVWAQGSRLHHEKRATEV